VSAPLRVSSAERVVRITLDRPPLNVLDRDLNRAIAAAVHEHSRDPDVIAIVLGGGGAKGFSAGVEVADHTPDRVAGMLEDFHGAVRALWRAECPTIAAIHGFALGGGLELAISCDMIVAEEDAKLGFPEIQLGCYPPVAAALLPGRVGWAAASELVLTGESFSVARAAALGLVNRVAAPGALGAEVEALLRPLRALSPAVVREAKHALREGSMPAAGTALARIEERYLTALMKLEDANEGSRSFMEKRAPKFANR
jgi:cyclohexa-1,5-dienecarbonyl-CoA hydratase